MSTRTRVASMRNPAAPMQETCACRSRARPGLDPVPDRERRPTKALSPSGSEGVEKEAVVEEIGHIWRCGVRLDCQISRASMDLIHIPGTGRFVAGSGQ